MIPRFRQYARTMSTPNLCDDCGCEDNPFPIVDPVSIGGKVVEILSSSTISVEDLSDADTYRFRPNYEPYTDLVVNLTLIAKEGVTIRSNPVLKGTIIDNIELDWTYNKDIATQTLTDTGVLSDPTLIAADRSYDFSGISVTSNITLTISGNDGNGEPGSVDSDAASITFGNYLVLGISADLTGELVTTLTALIAGFTKTIKTSRSHSYNATGGVNEHHIVGYPKAFGLGTFKKGIFEGGYVRLKKVGTVLKVELLEGDVEEDISVTNDKGYAEAYYFYMSLYDNQVDAVTPFVLS
jgi:hypothetical protein